MVSHRMPSLLSIAIILSLSAWIVQPAVAQMGWTNSLTDSAKSYNDISFSDPMNGYAVGFGSILRTTDGGQTWGEMLPAFLFNQNQLAVHALSADTVWSLTGLTSQVRHSEDGGANWRATTLGSGFYPTMAVNKAGVGIVAGGSQGAGVIERTGNGQTWTRVFSTAEAEFIRVHFIDDQNVWAVGAGAFARSTNSGLTWKAQNQIGNEFVLRDIFFLDENNGWVASPQSIYSTVDGGTTWELLGTITDEAPGISRIWFTSATTGWATAQTDIYYTVNGGVDWTSVGLETPLNPEASNMAGLFFVEADVGWAVGGNWNRLGGVIFSTNEATQVSSSNETPVQASLMDIFPNPLRRTTNIHFHLDQAADVSLRVYDILGRPVETVAHAQLAPGEHRLQWNRKRVAPGVYLLSLTAAGSVQTAKALVID